VGRTAELELFRAALAESEPSFTVLFLHGPGGVGKTALLDVLGDLAVAAGREPVRVDGRALDPTPRAFLAAAEGLPSERPVLLVDTFEAIQPLAEWLRGEFLPGLPAAALVVIAGREPPEDDWATDVGWRELLRTIALRNLPPEDVHRYLAATDVDPALHADVVSLSYGHPLAMVLTADLARRAGTLPPEHAPDIVRALVRRFTADLPSSRHRAALEISAHVRFTTEGLLRSVLSVDSRGLFEWLRSLAFMEESALGLYPHDVARDALDTDLRRRDPELFAHVHRQVREHVLSRVRSASGMEQQRRTTDLLFLHRGNPAVRGFWDWASLGDAYADRLRDGDREPIVRMTTRHQGAEQARLLEYWLDRQPRGVFVFRADGTAPIGYAFLLALHDATEADLAVDPGARAMWDYTQRFGPTRSGEEVYAGRFFMDAEAYQQPSRSMNMISVRHVQDLFSRARPAWDLIGVFEDAEFWAPMFDHIDFHRADQASYTIGGRTYSVFAHDWRQRDLDAWLTMMAEREIAESVEPADPPAPVLVLSQPDFADAVKGALRDLSRAERLADSPLLRSRLVRDEADPVDALRRLARRAADRLRGDARDEKLFRALDRTYLRPAPTQERAAELLGLPFSTYRRHLVRGIDRVVADLWRQELYGVDGPTEVSSE
jgi:hypothetical protein